MKKLIISILSIFFLSVVAVLGQNVQFTGSAKNVVRIGEKFNLVYSLNAEGNSFRGPEFKNFQVLTGPHTSQSSSVQIINGKVSRSVDYTYTYILSAREEGIFEIPFAQVNVDGVIYESNKVQVQVIKDATSQPSQQSGNTGSQKNTSGADHDYSDDVFLKVITSDRNPMQGEQIIITYKLYYRINISAPEFNKEPSFKGFWKNDLNENRKSYVQYTENYNGQQYNVAELKKYALFPQRSGQIVIEGADAICQAQVRAQSQQKSRDPLFDNFFNDPFFNRYQTIEIPLTINPITINVSPLPTNNRPAEFNGAVGSFEFKSTIDKTELKANEAITLKFIVNGTGNIELVDKVNVAFPPDFEVYDPKVSKNINITNNGVSGSKTFEYLIIPRTAGEFIINPVTFSFFDLRSKTYKSISTPEYNINVSKGDGSASNVTYSGINQADIKYIGSDIHYIKTNNPRFSTIGTFFFGSTTFYVLLIAPIILFILFIMLLKKELKKRSNIALMRNRKATKVAQKRMKKAHQFLKENNKNDFYIEVSQALWGYLSDKFSIPLSNLSMDTVSDSLKKKEVKEETVTLFIETLNNCEFARFAPGDSSSTMENIYNEAVNIISLIENELK